MAEVKNVDKLIYKLKSRHTKGNKKPVAVVGFAMVYAIYVHENLNARHAEGTTAKFLTGPARIYRKEIAKLVRETYKKTGNLEAAILIGALFLQRMAQSITPIDTGALRSSAYTALQGNAESVAAEAAARGQRIRDLARKK